MVNVLKFTMTKQEQVDVLVAAGKTSKEITAELQITAFTVRYYREKSKRANREIIQQRITEHRRKLKRKAIDYSGGSCLKCGYNKSVAALTFHHLDPTEKEYGIASGKSVGWDRTKTEVDKCIMLCQNCHAELHDLLWCADHRMIENQVAIRIAYVDKPLTDYGNDDG